MDYYPSRTQAGHTKTLQKVVTVVKYTRRNIFFEGQLRAKPGIPTTACHVITPLAP
jgi:hypothetical protein